METFENLLRTYQNIDQKANNQIYTFNEIYDSLISKKTQKKDYLKSKKQQLLRLKKQQREKRRENSINDNTNQMIFKKMENKQLLNEIYELELAIRNKRQNKIQFQEQIQLFDAKDQHIATTLVCSLKDFEEIRLKLQEEKKEGKFQEEKMIKEITLLKEKRDQIKQSLKQINQQLTQQNKIIQSVYLSPEKENKQIQTAHIEKIYTKIQLQQSLRYLYMIQKMKEAWGENIKINNLQQLQEGLDPIEKIRLISKTKIINRYQQLGCQLGNKMIANICQFYGSLCSKFDRMERANFQLSQTLSQLNQTQQQLNISIEKIQESKQKNTRKILDANQQDLNLLETKLLKNCKIIFQYNILTHYLIKRINNLHITLNRILKQSNLRGHSYKPTFYNKNQYTILIFQELLERSPEDVLLRWNQAIKIKSNSQKQMNSKKNQKIQDSQGKKYLNAIMKNDLLRVLAKPEVYNYESSTLQNENKTYQKVFQYEQGLICNFTKILENLIVTPAGWVKELQSRYIANSNLEDRRYCVESKQYFRRDDYKLLQKLERIELKKKGIFYKPPFEITSDQEMITQNKTQFMSQDPTFNSLGNSLTKRANLSTCSILKKHTNMLSEKRHRLGTQKNSIRKILGEISSIASQNYKYRIKKQQKLSPQNSLSESRMHC